MMAKNRWRPQEEEVNETILVPREVANADSVYLISWLVKNGEFVEAGAPICEVETSKAILSVETKHAGYLLQCVEAGDEVSIGSELGYLTVGAINNVQAKSDVSPKSMLEGVKFSAKAKQKIDELGIDPSLFKGRGLVRESDVIEVTRPLHSKSEKYTDPRGQHRIQSLGAIQRRVARNMEQSLAEIPVSYLEKTINLSMVHERSRSLAEKSKTLISAVDLLVHAVAHACLRFSYFNASLTKKYDLQIYEQINVGLAVDIENDLFVVVVKDVSRRSPEMIAKELRSLQYLAQRRQLTKEHILGGTITVSSLLGMGIRRFQPIPYMGQVAIVGITDSPRDKSQATLTLGFDHRIANGTMAARFLCAISDILQGSQES